MGLEAATFIHQLNAAWPVGASDPKGQGDDHLRMIKAALQATFPALTGAVLCSQAELNLLDGKTGTVWTSTNDGTGSGLDADLLRGVSGASYARLDTGNTFEASFTVDSTAPAIRWHENDQGLDQKRWVARAQDLQWTLGPAQDAATVASVNAIIITRLVDAVQSIALSATTITLNGVNVSDYPRLNVSNTWTASPQVCSNSTPRWELLESDASADNKRWDIAAATEQFRLRALTDAGAATNIITIDRTLGAIDNVSINAPAIDLNGVTNSSGNLQQAGANVIDIPRRTGSFARGQCRAITANVTINLADMAVGTAFSIYNDTAGALTITQGAGVTLRLAGTATTGNLTLAARGFATIWCNTAAEAIAMGHVS